jgi:hypothetical protein
MKKSELFHTQSVYFGGYYLPGNCPLVTHVINSYNKHYILPKAKKEEGASERKKSEDPKVDSKFQKNKIIQNFLIKKICLEKKNNDSLLNMTGSDVVLSEINDSLQRAQQMQSGGHTSRLKPDQLKAKYSSQKPSNPSSK